VVDMKTEERYENFLARLRHEVDRHGHGGMAYIAKNVGLKSGAFIGQILNPKTKKKAGYETQVNIGEFVCGSDERFIEEGRELRLYGHIKSKLPTPSMTAQATVTPPTPPNVTNISNKHHGVIEKFRDKERGLAINQDLVELESLDEDELEEVHDIIRAKLKKLRKTTTPKKTGTEGE